MLERLKIMPSKKQYDLVSDDGYDSRIPLHNDEAFTHGIPFTAKYIGTLDVPRPSSRVEIVAAMRRIRYEFKAKAIKKKKVSITISVEGVRIALKRKKRRKTDWSLEESRNLVMHHPIYRIFYVSHDSQDLKIFSYIARDGSTNVFKCNVFKSYKKSQAMRIVRTIGQAFEVCHKISLHAAQQESNGNHSDKSSKATEETQGKETISVSSPERVTSTDRSPVDSKSSTAAHSPRQSYRQEAVQPLNSSSHRDSQAGGSACSSQPQSPKLTSGDNFLVDLGPLPLTAQHKIQLLRLQVEQQQQQTQVAMAQVQLLKDQLTAETTARIESQARTHNLLIQNRELLDHIGALVRQMQEFEAQLTGTNLEEYNLLKTPLQRVPMPEAMSPEPGPIFIPGADLELSAISMARDVSFYDNSALGVQMNGDVYLHDSPGDMSAHDDTSLVMQGFNMLPNDGTIWHTPRARMMMPASTPSGSIVNYGAVVIQPQHSVNSSGTASGGSFNAIDAGYQRPNSTPRPLENGGATVTMVNSSGNPFVEDMSNSNYVIPNGGGSTGLSTSSSSSSEKFDKENNNNSTVIITPVPPQDASGNRVDLTVAPTLHPPPHARMVSRSPSTSGKDVMASPDANGNDSSNLSAASTSSSISLASESKRSSRDSSKLSTMDSWKETVVTNISTDKEKKQDDITNTTTAVKLSSKRETEKGTGVDTTANQNLKNLNMNLKSLKSPHKRHSSTSAELYGNKEHVETAKIAMQSSSESKLSHVNRTAGFDVTKKPVHINVQLAKS